LKAKSQPGDPDWGFEFDRSRNYPVTGKENRIIAHPVMGTEMRKRKSWLWALAQTSA
jgi:hypothetical protein